MSSSKSQQYKVEESCRQTERITPFIHYFPPFFFFWFCSVVRVILHPGWSLNCFSLVRDNNSDNSHTILALVEKKSQRDTSRSEDRSWRRINRSSLLPGPAQRVCVCASGRVCLPQSVRTVIGVRCVSVCARAQTVSDRLTLSWRGMESRAHHAGCQTPA